MSRGSMVSILSDAAQIAHGQIEGLLDSLEELFSTSDGDPTPLPAEDGSGGVLTRAQLQALLAGDPSTQSYVAALMAYATPAEREAMARRVAHLFPVPQPGGPTTTPPLLPSDAAAVTRYGTASGSTGPGG